MTVQTVYDDDEYLKSFDRFRMIPAGKRDFYAYDLLHRVRPAGDVRFLDVGAGTGQFFEPVARAAARTLGDGSRIRCVLLDPSPAMYERLRGIGASGPASATAVQGSLTEHALTGGRYDAILLSEVAHVAAPDPNSLAKDLGELSGDGCVVGIRFATARQIEVRAWYRWYRDALEIETERSPDPEALATAFLDLGYKVSTTVVDESRRVSTQDFQDVLVERAYSAFRLTDAKKHAEQSAQMLRDTAGAGTSMLFEYEMTWMVAQRA